VLIYQAGCRVATVADFGSYTYNNGTGGIGATITNTGANAAIVVDTITLNSGDRVLVKNQTNQSTNGIYSVTTVGNASTRWVLTRTTDYDQPSEILGKDVFYVAEGAVNQAASFVQLNAVTTVGVTPFVFQTSGVSTLQTVTTAGATSNVAITLSNTLTSNGNLVLTGANVSLGNVSNLHITGGSNGQVLGTDGTGNLSWVNGGSGNVSNIASISSIHFDVTVNANNQTFVNSTLVNYPSNAIMSLFRNGVLVNPTNYELSGNTLIVNLPLFVGDNLDIPPYVVDAGNANIIVSNIVVAGSNTQVQFNDSGNLGASANFTFNKTSNTLSTTNLTVAATSNLGNVGNVKITGGSNLQFLQTDGLGNLTWTSALSSQISNGNSNIAIVANANVNISSAGNANILVVTGTGANITGTANITGNLVAANANLGNLVTANNFTGNLINGNSNIVITANSNVRISSTGNANVLVVSGTGANVTGNGNITGTLSIGSNANSSILFQPDLASNTGALLTIGGGNAVWNIKSTGIATGNFTDSPYALNANSVAARIRGSNSSVANAFFETVAGASVANANLILSAVGSGRIYANTTIVAGSGGAAFGGAVDANTGIAIGSNTAAGPDIRFNSANTQFAGIQYQKVGTERWFTGIDSSSANGNMVVRWNASFNPLTVSSGNTSTVSITRAGNTINPGAWTDNFLYMGGFNAGNAANPVTFTIQSSNTTFSGIRWAKAANTEVAYLGLDTAGNVGNFILNTNGTQPFVIQTSNSTATNYNTVIQTKGFAEYYANSVSINNGSDTVITAYTVQTTDTTGLTFASGVWTNSTSRTLQVIITVQGAWAANAAGVRVQYVAKTAPPTATRYLMADLPSNSDFPVTTTSGTIQLTNGEAFRLVVYQNSGGSLTFGGASAAMSSGASSRVTITVL
jgi:hypothetical protein